MTNIPEKPPEPAACSIFSLGPLTCTSMLRLEEKAAFLIETHHIRRFYLVDSYCQNGYGTVLEHLAKKAELELVGVTCYSGVPAEWHEQKSRELVPPCHRVENIDTGTKVVRAKYLRRIKAMIDRSDFCICNLSGNPLAPNIQTYAAKKNRVLLDIGQEG